MSDHYELTTLQDVFDKVPAGKIELCLQEIGEGLAESKAIVENLKNFMGDAWSDSMMTMKWPMTWIDDDGSNGNIQLFDKTSGDQLGSIKLHLKEAQ